ncbi:hypothetical protein PV11_07230 [Exophiala sideris]|uniref:TLC domain-containing protein n=1 Tax=Exophiala sideris TaxID=1016849 RepID=A0A0D1YXZ2_9EURO|nr:hypothetical protein PV11_07230 [Exophiala sideris]
MIDPLPPPPPWLVSLVKPYCDALYLPTLPYHIHEVLFAFVLYQTTQSIFSPVLSTVLFPDIYPKLSRRTRINWDVHVVSLLQSCLINTLALWVMFTDEERYDMQRSPIERIYGYTGGCGLIQALATGYFMWDLAVSARNYSVFGPGILAHAVTALSVFSLGFRPFCNYYGPVFILYELSTPFLNIHWFCDKLNMTGSKLQWYNGMILLVTFFGCRLLWGTYNSLRVYQDIWHTMHLNTTSFIREIHESPNHPIFVPRDGQLCVGESSCLRAQSEVMQFTGPHTGPTPFWMAAVYLGCNLVLNSLNFHWFGRMIQTIRKRFEGKPHDDYPREVERKPSMVEEMATELDYDSLSGARTPPLEKAVDAYGKSTAVSDGPAEVKKR